jgi:queuosine precursor transporter
VTGIGFPLILALYVACELIANITAGRPVELWGVQAPGGVFIYALTFTLIDLINERLGKARARQVVLGAFAANGLLALYSPFVLSLPTPSFFGQRDAFAAVLGATPRIITASLAAYLVSSWIDVEIFAVWKARIGGRKWIRVLTSNAVSTAVDSILFVAIAFAGTLPLLPLITGQYVIKMAVTFVSLPLIYAARYITLPDAPAESSPA